MNAPAVSRLAGVFAPPVLSLGTTMPWVFVFHPFKSKNIAGRIKIKLLGFSCEHLPTCVCCLVTSVCVDSPFH